ncbi:nuclear transport factor 2 family protein [bacterium]|nr:MAG: nuclear transport factor 2 family protein [bacterium]
MKILTTQNSRGLLFGLLALSLGAAGVGAKETAKQSTDKKQLTELYAAADRAMVTRNVGELVKQVAPNFQYTAASGQKMNRAQFESMQKMLFNLPGFTPKSCKTTLQKFQWNGSKVSVWATTAYKASIQGSPMNITSQMRDEWQASRHGWQLVKSAEIKSTMNGRPMPQ